MIDHPAYFLTSFCAICDDEHTPDCHDAGHATVLTEADWVWRICDRCHGDGTLGGWPGAYTESDRAEWSDDDYEDYRTTRRPCEDCGGTGKVRDISDVAAELPAVIEAITEAYIDRMTRWAESGYGRY